MTDKAPKQDIPDDVREALPKWFDEEKHRWSCSGIQELATGLMLAGDGLPLFGHSRARRLAEAGATTDAAGLVTDGLIAINAGVLRAEAEAKAAEEAEAKRIERERKAEEKAAADAAKKTGDAPKTETPNA